MGGLQAVISWSWSWSCYFIFIQSMTAMLSSLLLDHRYRQWVLPGGESGHGNCGHVAGQIEVENISCFILRIKLTSWLQTNQTEVHRVSLPGSLHTGSSHGHPGRGLHLPTDGLLRSQWDPHPLVLLLPGSQKIFQNKRMKKIFRQSPSAGSMESTSLRVMWSRWRVII